MASTFHLLKIQLTCRIVTGKLPVQKESAGEPQFQNAFEIHIFIFKCLIF